MLPHRKHRWYLAQSLGLALAYAALGMLGLQLVVPPDYAAPLYPAAGLALAALLSLGLRHAPAIALGSFAVNLLLAVERGQPSLLSPALIGLGAALQALAGAWAVRRWVAQPLTLTEPRDLARFSLLGAALACVICPSAGTLAQRRPADAADHRADGAGHAGRRRMGCTAGAQQLRARRQRRRECAGSPAARTADGAGGGPRPGAGGAAAGPRRVRARHGQLPRPRQPAAGHGAGAARRPRRARGIRPHGSRRRLRRLPRARPPACRRPPAAGRRRHAGEPPDRAGGAP